VKPSLNFVGGPEKELWIWENNKCAGLYKTGFVQGPQKLNNGSGKLIHPRTTDRHFTVHAHTHTRARAEHYHTVKNLEILTSLHIFTPCPPIYKKAVFWNVACTSACTPHHPLNNWMDFTFVQCLKCLSITGRDTMYMNIMVPKLGGPSDKSPQNEITI
jgi:hypothetical protein